MGEQDERRSTLQPADGTLVGTFSANGGNGCTLRSSTLFDLKNHPVTVEIPSTSFTEANQEATLEMVTLDGATASLVIRDGELEAFSSAEQNPHGMTAYDGGRVWLRVGASTSGALTWSTSIDGSSFIGLATTQDLAGNSLDRVLLQTGIDGGGTSVGTATFDNFNLLP